MHWSSVRKGRWQGDRQQIKSGPWKELFCLHAIVVFQRYLVICKLLIVSLFPSIFDHGEKKTFLILYHLTDSVTSTLFYGWENISLNSHRRMGTFGLGGR